MAADQVAGGQRERASLTMQDRQLEKEAELLPSADATSPEARRVRAAGLTAINAQLNAEKSMLTGHHDGAVVAGMDRGQAGAELLAGRVHAQEEHQEAADIDATQKRINGAINGANPRAVARGGAANARLVGRAAGLAIGGPVGAIVGEAAGRLVAERAGQAESAGVGHGNEGSQAVVQELKQVVKMLGDFLGRTSHSSAMARGV